VIATVRYRDRTLRTRTVGLGPTGLVYRTADTGGWVGWDRYRRVHRSGPFLILDLGGAKQFVPLRVFNADEQVEIRRLLQAAGFAPTVRRP
jgi:hypothetical protein